MDPGSGVTGQACPSLMPASAKAPYVAPGLKTFGSVQKLTGWQRYPWCESAWCHHHGPRPSGSQLHFLG